MSVHHDPQDPAERLEDGLDDEEVYDEDELYDCQPTEPRSRWKWILGLWLVIAIGIWAVKESRMDEIRAKTADPLEATLEKREDARARMFKQLRLLKEQKDQGQISEQEYREKRRQITESR